MYESGAPHDGGQGRESRAGVLLLPPVGSYRPTICAMMIVQRARRATSKDGSDGTSRRERRHAALLVVTNRE
eukprot:9492723-Pyramimonas_sp.AAC.1